MLAAEDRMSTILDDLIEEEERTFIERSPEAPNPYVCAVGKMLPAHPIPGCCHGMRRAAE